MLRLFRAFAWLRWRIFVNSLERTGSRDTVQRFSIAIERLVSLIAPVVLIPSAIALGGLAAFAGWQFATGRDTLFEVVRFVMLGATLAAVFLPLVLPAADRTNPVRLLLLPIPERVLYLTQVAGTLTDPWILLFVPIALLLPVGLLAGGSAAGAAFALVTGLLFVITLMGISALATTVMHLVFRDRRRGELVALLLIVVLPLFSFIPAMIGSRVERRAAGSETAESRERSRTTVRLPAPVVSTARTMFSVMPSETATVAIRRGSRVGAGAAAGPFALSATAAVAVHVIGFLLFVRVLASPGSTSARREAAPRAIWQRGLPGVSPGTSAVSLTLLRLALRSPRGRSILLAPIIFLVFFGIMMLRGDMFRGTPLANTGGLGLAMLVAFFSLVSTMPIAMNQFAVDRAGLTMTLLAPLSTREILYGKALGVGLIALPSAFVSMAIIALVFPGGPPGLWLALPPALIATWAISTPLAAMLSSVFPRAVNMNSIGSGSNAHTVPSLIGIFVYAACVAPSLALAALAAAILQQPWLAPLLVVGWCAVAFGIAHLLMAPAERIFENRRESLVTVLGG